MLHNSSSEIFFSILWKLVFFSLFRGACLQYIGDNPSSTAIPTTSEKSLSTSLAKLNGCSSNPCLVSQLLLFYLSI